MRGWLGGGATEWYAEDVGVGTARYSHIRYLAANEAISAQWGPVVDVPQPHPPASPRGGGPPPPSLRELVSPPLSSSRRSWAAWMVVAGRPVP